MITLAKIFMSIVFSLFLNVHDVSSQDITVNTENPIINKGQVFVALYNSGGSFLNQRNNSSMTQTLTL